MLLRKSLPLAFALLVTPLVTSRAQIVDLQSAIKLAEADKWAEAMPSLVAAYRANPKNPTAALWAGKAYVDADSFETARKVLEAAVALNPKSSDAYDWLGKAYGSLAQRASIFGKAGLAKKTQHAWEKAVELDPNNLEAREDLIQFYLQAPSVMGGSKDKAVAEAAEIQKRDLLRGTQQVVNIYVADKKWPEAERALLSAIRIKPDTFPLQTSLASLYAGSNQCDKAFALMDAWLKNHPGDMLGQYTVGRTGATCGQQLDRAEAALNGYIAAYPKSAPKGYPSTAAAHWRLGMLREKRGDKVRARAEYTTALQLDPKLEAAKRSLKALDEKKS